MSVENPKPPGVTPRSRKRSSVGAGKLLLKEDRFEASLKACSQAEVRSARTSQAIVLSGETTRTGWQEICARALARMWTFLQAKYKTSTARRLLVSETISLGEKRFVAIVRVEGREFLIGGGVSSMSLLARLDKVPDSARRPRKKTASNGAKL